MKSKMLLVPVLLTMLACASFALDANRADRAQTAALDFSRYGFDPKKPLIDRVADAPDFVLNYLRKMDGRPDYAPHDFSREESALVQNEMELLPPGYKAILQQRLLGLYFVDNFSGSGYTEFVLDRQGRVFSFMAINSEVLAANLSDWLTRKENSAFSQDTDLLKITVDCGPKASALAWILLHEATHAVDYAENFTPYVEPALWELLGKPKRASGFTDGIWDGYDVPQAAIGWPYTGKVRFYGMGKGSGLLLSEAGEIYAALAKTPFASLYATQNWAEDLADYMAFFHITRTRGLPYTVRVVRGLKTEFEYRPFENINSPCRKRRAPGKLM